MCTPPCVVLIHGLFVKSFCMRPLGRKLRREGFRVVYFNYPSLRRSPRQNARALRDFILALETPEVHLVAHSLGGLVVRHLAEYVHELPPGRVVTLATPHQGSEVVSRLSRTVLRRVFGLSLEAGLLGGLPPWPAQRELGSLAGTRAVGIGQLVGGTEAVSDGTISLAETQLEGMRDHVQVSRSHADMLLSQEVAEQVLNFLNQGVFASRSAALGDIIPG